MRAAGSSAGVVASLFYVSFVRVLVDCSDSSPLECSDSPSTGCSDSLFDLVHCANGIVRIRSGCEHGGLLTVARLGDLLVLKSASLWPVALSVRDGRR